MARKLSVKELVEIMEKELAPPKDLKKLKVQQKPWDNGQPELDIEWLKALKIKELFAHKIKG